jgi:hypothetical protein
MDRIIVKKQTGIYRYHTREEIRTVIRLDRFGIWELDAVSDLSFDGYRFQFLNTFGAKVRYAISSLCVESTGMNDIYDEAISIVRRLIPECECVHLTPVIMADSPTY